MGRILAGKPVYTPEDIARQQGTDYQPPVQPVAAAPGVPQHVGPKVIPQIHCGRIESLHNGNRLDIYVDLQNMSNEPVFIDKLAVLGQHREVDRELRPGERHQVLIYSGAPLTGAPQGYLELQYRKQADGDYFKSFYQIHFEKDVHGFEITDFRQTALKDI